MNRSGFLKRIAVLTGAIIATPHVSDLMRSTCGTQDLDLSCHQKCGTFRTGWASAHEWPNRDGVLLGRRQEVCVAKVM